MSTHRYIKQQLKRLLESRLENQEEIDALLDKINDKGEMSQRDKNNLDFYAGHSPTRDLTPEEGIWAFLDEIQDVTKEDIMGDRYGYYLVSEEYGQIALYTQSLNKKLVQLEWGFVKKLQQQFKADKKTVIDAMGEWAIRVAKLPVPFDGMIGLYEKK